MKRKILALAMTLILIVSTTCIFASAEEQNYILFNGMTTADNLWPSTNEVTDEVFTDVDGTPYARFVPTITDKAKFVKVTIASEAGAVDVTGKKYAYFYVETPNSEEAAIKFELIGSGIWLANKGSFELLSASNPQEGWVKKDTDGWDNKRMVLGAGFAGWVRLEIANCVDGDVSASNRTDIANIGMLMSATGTYNFGAIYLAAGDEDVPGLPDIPNVLTFNDLADTNEIWINASYPVKAEVFTDGGVNYGRFVPNNDEADKVGTWFYVTMGSGSGALDITGKKYVYFYLKTPASTDANFSFELRNDSAYMGNKNSYELLSVSNLQAGWVKKTFDGNNMTVAAGFDGWARLEIANCYSSGDNPTYASNATDIKNIGMWINDSGRGDEALTFGVVYFATGDDNVPGLPDIPDAPGSTTGAVEIRDFDHMTAVGQDLTQAGGLTNAIWSVVRGPGLKVVTSDKGVANGNYSMEIVNADPTDNINYAESALIGSFANVDAVKGKRYIAFHISVPADPIWKNPQCVDSYYNAVFGINFGLRTTEGGKTIYWSNDGGKDYSNNAQLLKDGGSKLVDALTLEKRVLLPFGYSGWVVLDTQNFVSDAGDRTFSFDNAANAWELWLTQVGRRTGSVYFDSLYAFNECEAVPGMVFTDGGDNNVGYFDKNMDYPDAPKPQASATEIRDFDHMTAVGQDLTQAGGLTNAIWGVESAPGLKVVTSDKGVANGNYSMEIINAFSEDNTNYTNGNVVGSFANVGAVKGKRYIAFHIAVPAKPSWKNSQCVDAYENPIFGINLGLRTTEGGKTIYWNNNGGEYSTYSNKAKLLKDGGSKLVDAVTFEKRVLLPFGYSGWVVLDTQNFVSDVGNGTFSFDNTANVWSLTLTQAGKRTGSVYFDSLYAFNEGEAVPGMTYTDGGNDDIGYFTKYMGGAEDAGNNENTGAVEIRDFDHMTAVGQDLTQAGGLTDAIWSIEGALGLKVVTSDKGAANGSYSMEIVNADPDDNMNYTQGAVIGSFANKDAVKGKRYIAFHISVPADPIWKSPLRTDAYDNPVFGACIGLRTTKGGTTIYWTYDGGSFSNEAKLLKDGGSKLVDAVTLENFVLLPFGYSGWVVLDTQDFVPSTGEGTFSFDNTENVWELWLSQAGRRTGSVYFDSFYAFNEGEAVPGMVFTDVGNDDIGYFTKYMGEDEDAGDNEDEYQMESVPTGEVSHLLPVTAIVLIAAALLTVTKKRRFAGRQV